MAVETPTWIYKTEGDKQPASEMNELAQSVIINATELSNIKDDVAELSNKTYNPVEYSGMGRVILRKNIVGGVNFLTQEMINQDNTIYEVRYDYDLNDQTITIPSGCVLLFEGGSVTNGILQGQNTIIESTPTFIFKGNISLEGTWNTERAFTEWFGANLDESLDCSTAINKCINSFESTGIPIHFLNNEYKIKNAIILKNKTTLVGSSIEGTIISTNGLVDGLYLINSPEQLINDPTTIVSDILANTTVIPVANASLFSKNDLINLSGNIEICQVSTAKIRYNWELHNVHEVDLVNNTITISEGTTYPYMIDSLVSKIDTIGGISISNLSVKGVGDKEIESSNLGIGLKNIKNGNFANIKVSNCNYTGINIQNCYNLVVRDYVSIDNLYSPNGTSYGISINDSKDITIDRMHTEVQRHACAIGGFQLSANIRITNSILKSKINYAADCHAGYGIFYENCTIIGGAVLGPPFIVLSNCVITNYNTLATIGVRGISTNTQFPRTTIIKNCEINHNFKDATRDAFYIADDPNEVDNTIFSVQSCNINTTQNGQYFSISGGNVIFSNNTFTRGSYVTYNERNYYSNIYISPRESITCNNNTITGGITIRPQSKTSNIYISGNNLNQSSTSALLIYNEFAPLNFITGSILVSNNTIREGYRELIHYRHPFNIANITNNTILSTKEVNRPGDALFINTLQYNELVIKDNIFNVLKTASKGLSIIQVGISLTVFTRSIITDNIINTPFASINIFGSGKEHCANNGVEVVEGILYTMSHGGDLFINNTAPTVINLPNLNSESLNEEVTISIANINKNPVTISTSSTSFRLIGCTFSHKFIWNGTSWIYKNPDGTSLGKVIIL